MYACIKVVVSKETDAASMGEYNRGLSNRPFVRADEGLTFEMSAFKLFKVANFRYQPS